MCSFSCNKNTFSDFVAFSNFDILDRKLGRACGIKEKIKESVKSDDQFFRILFKSNDVYDARGFEAIYQFRKTGESLPWWA